MTRRYFIAALLASAALAAGAVTNAVRASKKKKGRSGRDHDDAWSAREGGSILPLTEVLALIGPQIDGNIIETEFEYEHGRPLYEFKYVDKKGRVRELYVDARTGVILKDKPD
ncbi:peptidase propeptide and YPEB domain protein [bacterium BMS3Bbin10]|nr:peptidase propeptide and YPEB domain protein [bacterium BMS3Bbin10]